MLVDGREVAVQQHDDRVHVRLDGRGGRDGLGALAAGGPAGDAAARDGVGAGRRLCAGRALPVPRPARLLFAALLFAGAREPIWPTCQAAMPPVVSRATVVTMAVIVIPWPGDSRNRRSGRTASPVSGGLAPG